MSPGNHGNQITDAGEDGITILNLSELQTQHAHDLANVLVSVLHVCRHRPVAVMLVFLLFLLPVRRVEEVEAAQSRFHGQADHAGGAAVFPPLREQDNSEIM